MKDYIGDGVYISDELNEGHLTLTTSSHLPEDADNIIHLEDSVLQNFLIWINKRKQAKLEEKFNLIRELLPENLRYRAEVYGDNQLDIDNLTHEDALIAMRALKAGRWERSENGSTGKLDYVATIGDIKIRLWAAGPPNSCRVVEEEYDIPASKGVRKRVICRETVHPDEISSEQAL